MTIKMNSFQGRTERKKYKEFTRFSTFHRIRFEAKSKRDMVHNEMKGRYMGISSCSQTRLLINPLHESIILMFRFHHILRDNLNLLVAFACQGPGGAAHRASGCRIRVFSEERKDNFVQFRRRAWQFLGCSRGSCNGLRKLERS